MKDETKSVDAVVYNPDLDHNLDQYGFSLAHLDRPGLIANFDELCAALNVVGIDGFEDWLEGVHDENDWVSAQTEVHEHGLQTFIHQSPIQDVDFTLTFPCTLGGVWEAVHAMEATVSRHQIVMYTPVEAFGFGGGEDDDISTLAKIWHVTETSLAEALGGPWTPVEDGPIWDYNGDVVYQWFSRGEPATVWLGLGGDSVYIESVTHLDGTPTLAEWPEPATANILYAESESYRLTETEFLKRLADDLSAADRISRNTPTPIPPRKRRNMADHDVRLSTSDLRVAGIDLESQSRLTGKPSAPLESPTEAFSGVRRTVRRRMLRPSRGLSSRSGRSRSRRCRTLNPHNPSQVSALRPRFWT